MARLYYIPRDSQHIRILDALTGKVGKILSVSYYFNRKRNLVGARDPNRVKVVFKARHSEQFHLRRRENFRVADLCQSYETGLMLAKRARARWRREVFKVRDKLNIVCD